MIFRQGEEEEEGKGGEERETKAGRFQDLTSLPFPLAFSLPLVTSAVLHHTSRKNLLNAK